MSDEKPTTAVATRDVAEVAEYSRPPLIDIKAEKEALQNFRDFIHEVLEEDKGHFGKMPGVPRSFLQQPGAEIVYRALQARPQYTVIESVVDWDADLCYFLYRCEVFHVTSGFKMGEDFGAASSLEYATACTGGMVPSVWDKENNRPGAGPAEVICPIHGAQTPRRNKVDNKWFYTCPKKTPVGLDRTLQNVQSKAKKRAMVAAIRTVGCVSEMFSQDSDLVDNQDGPADDRPRSTPQSRSAPAPAKGRAAAAKPGPAPQGGGNAGPTTTDGFSIAEVKEAMAVLKDSLQMHEIRAFFEDSGVLEAGAPLTARPVTEYCKRNKVTLPVMVAAAVERFQDKPAAEVPKDNPEVVDGEVVEDVDDLPFE